MPIPITPSRSKFSMGWHSFISVLSKKLPLLCHPLPECSRNLKFLKGLKNVRQLRRRLRIGMYKPIYWLVQTRTWVSCSHMCILTSNRSHTCPKPNLNTFRLLNLTEWNYIITKREALAMVYALHKFKHSLLGNWFVFYVDHMVLVYLVNKPQVFSKIVRWLFLFLEYDFKIVYKHGRSHLMENALSRLPNQVELVGVHD